MEINTKKVIGYSYFEEGVPAFGSFFFRDSFLRNQSTPRVTLWEITHFTAFLTAGIPHKYRKKFPIPEGGLVFLADLGTWTVDNGIFFPKQFDNLWQ